MEAADPDAGLKIWQLDGALLSTPMMAVNQSSSYPLQSMAYAGHLPPIWPFLDELLRRASIPQSTEILAQIKVKRIRLAE